MQGSRRRAGTDGQPRTERAPVVAIVDDDASVRQSMLRLIRSFGYRAEAFGSGEEFLRSPTAAGTACLLLDVRMPSITGQASDDEERRARRAGAVEFLRKPVGRATLFDVLQTQTRQK